MCAKKVQCPGEDFLTWYVDPCTHVCYVHVSHVESTLTERIISPLLCMLPTFNFPHADVTIFQFWWIDPVAGNCGIYASQLLPPGDPTSIALSVEFHKEIYACSNGS